LQNPYEKQNITAGQLYDWAVVKIQSVSFEYCTAEDYSKETVMLKDRFRKAQTLQVLKKYIVLFLPQEIKFKQKRFQLQIYSTPHA
jgi:hypothetical protein